jgi:hypothetical protein
MFRRVTVDELAYEPATYTFPLASTATELPWSDDDPAKYAAPRTSPAVALLSKNTFEVELIPSDQS